MTNQYKVTEKQAEAIQVALELGLYDVPRTAKMQDVADELGIGRQAVSERLRRGAKPVLTEEFKHE